MLSVDRTESAVEETGRLVEYAHGLALHFSACKIARDCDEIDPPRYASKRVPWIVTARTLGKADDICETVNRLAALSARAEMHKRPAEDVASVALPKLRETVATLQRLDIRATVAFKPRERDAQTNTAMRGYVQEIGGQYAVERLRNDETNTIGDHDRKQADYSAGTAGISEKLIMMAAEDAARMDAGI